MHHHDRDVFTTSVAISSGVVAALCPLIPPTRAAAITGWLTATLAKSGDLCLSGHKLP